ncbi:hypothetical protein MUA04_00790 [Enterobacteriaceae bacterium H11S18]|uniref:hypothetical protein n=1 Tax=Dryocola clanedunensis TaxID=2925396 RepID=UPI0022F0641F|nr:hypothetical protein [Dryocola clanedunensis]MCT4708774.1 hypothetical protein [Dryocola clanedunensis]
MALYSNTSNTYNGPVFIINAGSPVPPEQPPEAPTKKKSGRFSMFLDAALGTVVTLWQAGNNGWMMAGLTTILIWAGVPAGAAPVWATGIIAFGVSAAPSVLRWLYKK